jgi:SAM-dependent methyltransferase
VKESAMDRHVIGLLLLAGRLVESGRPLGRQTLVPLAELKLPGVATNYDALVLALLEQELVEGDAESFSLTPDGVNLVRGAREQHSLTAWFYDEYYQAVLHSKAHSLFCERVYGKDLCQHGVADMAQIGTLLSELRVEAGMALLDFGCGDGRIAEYISDTTQALVTGVDIARRAIELAQMRTQAKRDRLCFYWADVERNRGTWPPGRFDRIVAIDSLFFARDQRAVTQALLGSLAPGGELGVFYHCPGHVFAGETALAGALQDLGASFRVLDLSTQNAQHWRRKKQVLLELEPLFRQEGNTFLFKNRLAECEGLEQFHRYLYLVTAI